MSRLSPKRHAAVSFGIILWLAAMTASGWAWLGYQGAAKQATEKPVAKKAVPQAPAKAATAPATKKPATPPKATVTATTAVATVSAAAAIDKLHPAKPVFLYIWDGCETHQKSWEATGFQKSLAGSGLDKTIGKLVEYAGKGNGNNIGVMEVLLTQFASRAFTKGASISIALQTTSGVPTPQVTIVLQKSVDQAKVLDELFAGVLKEANPMVETIADRKVTRVAIPGLDGYEFGWWVEGEHVVLAGGLHGIEAAIDVVTGKSANLTSNALVQKLRKSADFDVASVSLVDLKAILDLVRDLDVPPLPGSEKPPIKVSELLKIAGVDQVGVLSERWGFKGEAIWVESDLEVPAPLSGLMTPYDQKPLTLKDLPTLPAGCEYFMLARHDLSKTYATLYKVAEEIAEKIAPPSAPPVSDALMIINEAIGFDLKADLMDPLGDTIALYATGNGLAPSAVLLVKLDDAKKVLSALEKLDAKAQEQLDIFEQFNRPRGQREIEMRTKETLGRKLHIVQILSQAIVSPTWVVDKDWLVIGTTSQAVESYLKRVDGKLPKWQPPTEIAATQKMLPDSFATFYYFDPRDVLKTGLGMAPTGIAMLEDMSNSRGRFQNGVDQKVDQPKFPIAPEDIPLAEEVIAPLFPSIGTCTVDATGIHWRNRNSIPGLFFPGIPGGIGGVDSLALGILPSYAILGFRSVVHLQPPAVIEEKVAE